MADIYYPNKAPAATNDWFSHTWFLTRILLKAGWRSVASSDATNKETTGGIAACKWGAATAIGGQTGAVASITSQSGLDFVITGLTGLVSPTRANQGGSEGNYLTFTGAASAGNNATFQISKVISSTSCQARPLITTGVASDANNGAISWTEKSTLTTTYTAMASGAWIVLRGPSTMKLPFTSAPSGTFIRGENVVQSTTGAEAEVLGVTYEPSTGVGYMVIAPRLNGTGADQRGWDHSHVITGARSAATFTPSAAGTEYVREIMYTRSTTLFNGQHYYCCLDVVGEASSLFSAIATQAGTTATIPPGCANASGNVFPAVGAFVLAGTSGAAGTTAFPWNSTTYSTSNVMGNMQVFAANNIERQSVSADASFLTVLGQPTTSNQSSGSHHCFFRLDNQEEGDVEPYAWYSPIANNAYDTRSRTTAASANGITEAWNGNGIMSSSASNWITFRRRGFGTGDAFTEVAPALTISSRIATTPLLSSSTGTTDPEKAQHSAQTAAPLAMEPITLVSTTATFKFRKGIPRYVFCINGNSSFDTFGAKVWLQASPFTAGALNTLTFVVPYDGTTVPVQ